jgi:hypothetical protein
MVLAMKQLLDLYSYQVLYWYYCSNVDEMSTGKLRLIVLFS